jgi:hypothetical protein
MPGAMALPDAKSVAEFHAQRILLYLYRNTQQAPLICEIMAALQMPESEAQAGVEWLIENNFIEYVPTATPTNLFAQRFNERSLDDH